MKREHCIDWFRASICETVFDAGNRQTGIVCIAGGERAPPRELYLERHLGFLEADCPKGKSRLERGLLKPWEPPAAPGIVAFYAGQIWL